MTGTNLAAACLVARRLTAAMPGATARVVGEGMDCRVKEFRQRHPVP